jgi:GNAT superfamily N-acetyltransferase
MIADETITDILYRISPSVSNEALNELFGASWANHVESDFQPQLQHSLIYVCAYHHEQLVGFVNVAWDGGIHGFLLNTTVHPSLQRHGIGVQLVRKATRAAQTRGIRWLHVDYEPHLDGFYQKCGFHRTQAGLINLNGE